MKSAIKIPKRKFFSNDDVNHKIIIVFFYNIIKSLHFEQRWFKNTEIAILIRIPSAEDQIFLFFSLFGRQNMINIRENK